MIVGMDVPTQGEVEVLQTKVPHLSLLQNIGYMAQSDALYPELTGKENLTFFCFPFFKLKKRRTKSNGLHIQQI
ncbi:hypothetical protein GCM10020331_076140 [Ectobacillus funiculus]